MRKRNPEWHRRVVPGEWHGLNGRRRYLKAIVAAGKPVDREALDLDDRFRTVRLSGQWYFDMDLRVLVRWENSRDKFVSFRSWYQWCAKATFAALDPGAACEDDNEGVCLHCGAPVEVKNAICLGRPSAYDVVRDWEESHVSLPVLVGREVLGRDCDDASEAIPAAWDAAEKIAATHRGVLKMRMLDEVSKQPRSVYLKRKEEIVIKKDPKLSGIKWLREIGE